ncbi:MAG: hypothetical protein HZB57_09265 [Gammaproteobacteria bacterium]|nr:hypothetical protein [Gammaproteobacteria bacterium]
MSDAVWIIGALLGIAVVWFLFKAILGFSLPAEKTGNAYLRKGLEKMGIGRDIVSDECLSELVSVALNSAKIEKMTGKHFNNSFVDGLDAMADTVRLWIHSPSDVMFRPVGEEKSMYRDIFERHKIPTVPQ